MNVAAKRHQIPSKWYLEVLWTFNASGCGYIGDLSGFTSIVPFLDLSHNNLNGSLDAIPSHQQVAALDLSHNQLTGSFPSEWGSSRSPARLYLDISHNLLSGTIDTPGSSWDDLQVFKASHNNFSGPVPSPPPSTLETFWIDGNSFDLCPSTTTMPVLQSCRLEGENQRVSDCACSDFYFRKHCSLNTDCIPPPMAPPVGPPSPVDPGSPINPGNPINPGTPSSTTPSANSAPHIAVPPIMAALVALGSLFFA